MITTGYKKIKYWLLTHLAIRRKYWRRGADRVFDFFLLNCGTQVAFEPVIMKLRRTWGTLQTGGRLEN